MKRLRVGASASGERAADCQQSADGGRLPVSHYCMSDGRSSADTHSGPLRVPRAASELLLQVVYLHGAGAPAAVTHRRNKRANSGGEEEICPHRYFCAVNPREGRGGWILLPAPNKRVRPHN